MKSNRIRSIFKRVYNNKVNPIFCYPFLYFQHGEFICEVAASEPMSNFEPNIYNPLNILQGLFYNQGYWVTVLKRHNGEYIKTDLNTHFDDWKKELNKFINTKLNTKKKYVFDSKMALEPLGSSPTGTTNINKKNKDYEKVKKIIKKII